MFLLPDTNFFLHFTHPRETRWSDIGAEQDVRIVCTRTIQSELDKKKRELKGRAQQRAREFSRLFLNAALEPEPLLLREVNPRVTLHYFERPASFVVPGALDSAEWGDDSFVADVLAFLETHPGERTLLISGDAGPILTAKVHGVPYRHLHDLGWELPPEPDDRGRLIESLQRDVKQLQAELMRSGPQIEGNFDVPGNAHKVETTFVRYSVLDDGVSEELVDELRRHHPKMLDFPPPSDANSGEWTAPTEAELTAYVGRYDAWIEKAYTVLSKLPETLAESETRVETGFTIRNVGAGPAEHLLVEFRSSAGLYLLFPKLCDDKQDEEADVTVVGEGPPRLPPPPAPPRWKAPPDPAKLHTASQLSRLTQQMHAFRPEGLSSVSMLNDILRRGQENLNPQNSRYFYLDTIRQMEEQNRAYISSPVSTHLKSLHLPSPPDDDTFYIKEGERGFLTNNFSFDRIRFRHGSSAHTFRFEVSFDPESSVRGGQVEVEVHAANLRAPFRLKLAVVRNIQDAEMVKEARAALGLPPHAS